MSRPRRERQQASGQSLCGSTLSPPGEGESPALTLHPLPKGEGTLATRLRREQMKNRLWSCNFFLRAGVRNRRLEAGNEVFGGWKWVCLESERGRKRPPIFDGRFSIGLPTSDSMSRAQTICAGYWNNIMGARRLRANRRPRSRDSSDGRRVAPQRTQRARSGMKGVSGAEVRRRGYG